MLPARSKCIMSWCGGESEGRDMGGLWREVGGDLSDPSPAPNIERPGLTWAELAPSLLSHPRRSLDSEEIRFMAPLRVSEYISI